MSSPLMQFHSTAQLPDAAPEALSDELYVRAALEGFRGMRGFRQLETQRPAGALTEIEQVALNTVGLIDSAAIRRDAENARQEALDVFFQTYTSALSTADVAQLLAVNPSRIRQRVKERSLLPLTQGANQTFPAAWFEGAGEVPGLRQVLPALPHDMRPLEALSWWLTPSAELAECDGQPQAPRGYLLKTGDVARVIAFAEAMARGEAA